MPLALLSVAAAARGDLAARTIDLATLASDARLRVQGALGEGGIKGVPVAAGADADGDGHEDVAIASMRASPQGRSGAGVVHLVFGDGTAAGALDTAAADPRILEIQGDGDAEATGAEIWLDDVTGDGLGDLLIGRQNHRPDAGRPGAGALTIVVGSPALRALAAAGTPLDLRAPPGEVAVATLVGPSATARLGIWLRSGDVTGDGVADVAVGADQESDASATHRGSVYVVRGGPHLAATQTVDLAALASPSFALAGAIARIRPPAGVSHLHFGATCEVADQDGNGRAEVLVAAALSRVGATIQPAGADGTAHSNGGTLDGTLYAVWDESFPDEPWPDVVDLTIGDAGVIATTIDGGAANGRFGEEIVGGQDLDGDGAADLFVGDLVGSAPGRPTYSGLGHVLFDFASLRGLDFDLDAPPQGLVTTTLLGAIAFEIAADTAIGGDFDGDGRDDLAVSSPHAAPGDRVEAGALFVLYGRDGAWPAQIDLAPGALPPPGSLRITHVLGARGASLSDPSDQGDTLAYSAAAGDVDGDGLTDLVVNEMLGNGAAPSAVDAGTLVALSGRLLTPEPGAALLACAALATLAALRPTSP